MLPAMVLAAGLGTRLRPLTFELPKPMVPLLDRPAMAHTIDLLHHHGIDRIVANLHYFPDTIRDYFGDELTYVQEEELLGTAGGVRNAKDFFGDEPFLVLSGDALTDLDVQKLVDRHEAAGGVATLCVKRVTETSEYGVVLTDSDGRITGFQEKPDPAEALSDLANCGMYLFSPEIFDYFPDRPFVDWANDVFPALLAGDVPFHVYEMDEYWNDVGALDELRNGTFDALSGALHLEALPDAGPDAVMVGSGSSLDAADLVEGPIWVGRDVQIGAGVRLQGPLVLGDGVVVEDGAAIKRSIVLPGTRIAANTILIEAITGSTGIVASLRPRADTRLSAS
ncbi:sugar phosphate nucleotidyltransferase [Patulibacter minatonensis]|uniref:sugar phosphate nucleotidyltransferase n=1 Tax=Patulibacter minatonensis TaxID=298163 RepID=UPI001FDF9350|nr:NDP-sugar synthase [Patulibacter minatonensis]